MTVITPVGGIIGPRPTGASFRTGVWKQQEVFVLRQDGVWQTPLYPDLAPYAVNDSGEILAAVFDPTMTSMDPYPELTTSYVKPRQPRSGQDISLDSTRVAFVVNQAVNSNVDWRFTLRYYDEPNGSNVFGLTPQANNVKRVSSGNWGNSAWGSGGRGFGFYFNLGWIPVFTWGEYIYRNYAPEQNVSSYLNKQNSRLLYRTSYSTSTAQWPFGQASNYIGNYAGYNQYGNESDVGRSVALWLLPP